jgi:hypothetical protein
MGAGEAFQASLSLLQSMTNDLSYRLHLDQEAVVAKG